MLGKHNHVPDTSFDTDQLSAGTLIELEHTDNPAAAKAIAKDHLMEIPDYYTRLLRMEEQAKAQNQKAARGVAEYGSHG